MCCVTLGATANTLDGTAGRAVWGRLVAWAVRCADCGEPDFVLVLQALGTLPTP